MADADPVASSSPPTNTTSSTPQIILPTTQPSVISLSLPVAIKLNQSNFITWKSQILPIIYGYGLKKFIEQDSPTLTIVSPDGVSSINPEYHPWHQQDQLLLGWLRSSLTESVLAQVVSCQTSAQLWTSLNQSYSSTSRARLIELRRQLQTTTKGSQSCADFLAKMQSIADELAFAGAAIPQDDLVLHTLNGLGADFNAFVATITSSSRLEPLTMADLRGLLLSHEALLSSQQTDLVNSPNPNPSAFLTRGLRPRPGSASSHLTRFFHPQRPAVLRPGTTSPQKPPLLPTPSRPSGPRPTTPHFQGPRPPYPSPGPSSPHTPYSHTPVQRTVCQICSKPGHSANKCWYRFDSSVNYQALVAQSFVPPPSPTEWVLDSGATHHVTPDLNNLTSFVPFDGSNTLQIGNGAGMSIHHIGSSSLSLSNHVIYLTNILHVPSFTSNLLSLSQLLIDNNLLIEFSLHDCIIKDRHTKTVLLRANSFKGLFTIPLQPASPQAFKVSADV